MLRPKLQTFGVCLSWFEDVHYDHEVLKDKSGLGLSWRRPTITKLFFLFNLPQSIYSQPSLTVLKITFSFHSLSKLYISVPSFFFFYLPRKMICPLLFLHLLFHCHLEFSSNSSFVPSLPISCPSPPPSIHLQSLLWISEQWLSPVEVGNRWNLGGQNDTWWIAKMAATHCIITELISTICAHPVSQRWILASSLVGTDCR